MYASGQNDYGIFFILKLVGGAEQNDFGNMILCVEKLISINSIMVGDVKDYEDIY